MEFLSASCKGQTILFLRGGVCQLNFITKNFTHKKKYEKYCEKRVMQKKRMEQIEENSWVP